MESHLRIADHALYSDLIPRGRADMILAIEPLESLRYVSFLSDQGAIVANKRLEAALIKVRSDQQERDRRRLASPRPTVRQKNRIRAAMARAEASGPP